MNMLIELLGKTNKVQKTVQKIGVCVCVCILCVYVCAYMYIE